MKTKETLRTSERKTVISLLITLSLMILALLVGSLFFSSQNAQKGYTFEQEKLKNEILKKENLSLKTKITDSVSIKNLENQEKIKFMDFVREKIFVMPQDNIVK